MSLWGKGKTGYVKWCSIKRGKTEWMKQMSIKGKGKTGSVKQIPFQEKGKTEYVK